ncbi:Mu transposase domain-containing protein [Streptomyces malaysiensis]|uniref:Mu transposase domain-containing protein n=1 Tax=Streptomyces malaysiensis TaxID=92644 RepID=UPI003F4D4E94
MTGRRLSPGSRRRQPPPSSVGYRRVPEVGHLLPLPDDPFTTGITLTPRVDRYGLITVKMCRYSVPVRFIDRKVTVTLTCDELIVYDASADCAGVSQRP